MKFMKVLLFVLLQMVFSSACSNDLVGADPWELDDNDEFSSVVVPDAGQEDTGPPDPVDANSDLVPDMDEVDVNPDVDASMEGPAVAHVKLEYDSRVLMGERFDVTLVISGGEPGCMVEGFEIVYEDGLDNLSDFILDGYDFFSTFENNTSKIELTEPQPLDGFEVTFKYLTTIYGPDTAAIETNDNTIIFKPVLDREDCFVDKEPTLVAEFAAVDSDKGLEVVDNYGPWTLGPPTLFAGLGVLGIVKIEADYWQNLSKIGGLLDLVIQELNFRVKPGQGVDVYNMSIERIDISGSKFFLTQSFNNNGDKVFGLDTFGDYDFEIYRGYTAYFLIEGEVILSADSDRKLMVFYEGGMFTSGESNAPFFTLNGEVLVSEFR